MCKIWTNTSVTFFFQYPQSVKCALYILYWCCKYKIVLSSWNAYSQSIYWFQWISKKIYIEIFVFFLVFLCVYFGFSLMPFNISCLLELHFRRSIRNLVVEVFGSLLNFVCLHNSSICKKYGSFYNISTSRDEKKTDFHLWNEYS